MSQFTLFKKENLHLFSLEPGKKTLHVLLTKHSLNLWRSLFTHLGYLNRYEREFLITKMQRSESSVIVSERIARVENCPGARASFQ